MGFGLTFCAVAWNAQPRQRGLWSRSPNIVWPWRHLGFSWRPLGAAWQVERCAPPQPRGRHQAQPQPPALSSLSLARACCLHPTESLTAWYPVVPPAPRARNRLPPSFQLENGLQGPRLCVLPTASGLATLDRRASWISFGLGKVEPLPRNRTSIGSLYAAEGSRGLLIFTRVTWEFARQNWPKLHELLVTHPNAKSNPVDLGWTSAVLLRRRAKSSTLLSKFRALFLGVLKKVQGAGFVRGKWFSLT